VVNAPTGIAFVTYSVISSCNNGTVFMSQIDVYRSLIFSKIILLK